MATNNTNDANATIWYLKNLPLYSTTKPYVVNLPLHMIPPGKRTNQISVAVPNIRIRDLREVKESFDIDNSGLQYKDDIHSAMAYEDWEDPEKIMNIYVKEVGDYLKRTLGAERTILLSQNVRRRHGSFPELPRGNKDTEADQPIQGVHADFTPGRAQDLILQSFGEEATAYLFRNRRVQFIHVWRPLRGPVMDFPLALCDYRSIDVEKDLVAVDNVYPHVVSETYSVLHNPKHTWYYLSNQMPHETLLFKGFDTDNVAKCTFVGLLVTKKLIGFL
ncbi:hypothetical protein CC80DRAFT_557569 [Byssothecium circinans]|uniref:CmcJ-like methyltransferase n=1 Tax=Byssothecium circinans TaxID=147558 RepID=A0A6A5UFZ8_9PLEO|nr:hypothetical protein CC80DRAFT_557569 [Byssothecium circinans]